MACRGLIPPVLKIPPPSPKAFFIQVKPFKHFYQTDISKSTTTTTIIIIILVVIVIVIVIITITIVSSHTRRCLTSCIAEASGSKFRLHGMGIEGILACIIAHTPKNVCPLKRSPRGPRDPLWVPFKDPYGFPSRM